MNPRRRLDYLDGLRGLLALYVTACHAYLTYAVFFRGRTHDPVADSLLWGMGWLGLGRSAVAGFIVLSGYCLMLPVTQSIDGRLRGGMLGFLRRRAGRILPPYYGALLVSLALIATVPGLQESHPGAWQAAFWRQVFPAFTPGVLLSHIFLVHNYNVSWQHAIDYPMWSLATEWQIYFLFPAFVAIWRRRTAGDVVLNAMRITLLLQVLLVVMAPGFNPWPAQFVTLFAFGMASATVNFPRAEDKISNCLAKSGLLAAAMFLLFLVLQLTVGGWLRDSGHQQVEDLLIGGAVAYLVINCGRARLAGDATPILRILEANRLVALGRFSYSLYLIHAPVLALLFLALQALRLPCAIVQLSMLGLGIPLSVLTAFVFSLVFERPFLPKPSTIVGAIPRPSDSPNTFGRESTPPYGVHEEARRPVSSSEVA